MFDNIGRLRINIFKRIFIAFLIAIIPSYIVILVINWIELDKVHKMMVDSIKSEENLYITSLEQTLEEIVEIQREYVNDLNFNRMIISGQLMDNQTRINTIRNMQTKMVMSKNSNVIINDVYILVPGARYTIGTNSFRSDIDMDEYTAVSDYANYFGTNMLLWKDRLLICIPYPDMVMTAQPPLYVTEVEIDRKQLIRRFKLIQTYDNSSVILLNSDKTLIAASTNDSVMIDDSKKIIDSDFLGDKASDESIRLNGRTYYISIQKSDILDMYMVVYLPQESIYKTMEEYNLYFIVAITMIVATIIIFSYWEYRTLYKPLSILINAFGKLKIGYLEKSTISHGQNDPFYYIYDKYNEMTMQLQKMIEVAYEQKIQSQQAELRHLQSQINPHMLANSFFTLYQMAKLNDVDNIMKFSKNLSRYYRFLTRTNTPDIKLEDEFENSKSYVEINNILHSNNINVTFEELPEETGDVYVPKLIIQPLIENAYKHARLGAKENPEINVRLARHADTLQISVQDNGEGISGERLEQLQNEFENSDQITTEMSGIMNVHKRLRLKFGAGFGVKLYGEEGRGFMAVITIPLV